MMKSVGQTILLIVTLSLSCICMGGAENPNVGASFRANNTVPSENHQRRLISSPNPVSMTGNDIITGNVGGLGYFHGVVPYGTTYYNRANLSDSGTSSVSSFLRRSVNPVLSDRNPGQMRVFYEPSRTVSSFNVPTIPRAASSEAVTTGRSSKSTYLTDLPAVSRTEMQQRPLSADNDELDRILARQFELKEKAKESNRKALQEKESDFQNIFEIKLETEKLEKSILEEKPSENPQEPPLEKAPEESTVENIQPLPERNQIEPVEKTPSELDMQLPEHVPVRRDIPTDKEQTETAQDDTTANERTGIDLETIRERAIEHAEAERILGEHKTLESLSESRFVDYMQTAEAFMQEGRYYKAADTYALAAIWKPDDPRTYLAQSFALFSAGEYEQRLLSQSGD